MPNFMLKITHKDGLVRFRNEARYGGKFDSFWAAKEDARSRYRMDSIMSGYNRNEILKIEIFAVESNGSLRVPTQYEAMPGRERRVYDEICEGLPLRPADCLTVTMLICDGFVQREHDGTLTPMPADQPIPVVVQ